MGKPRWVALFAPLCALCLWSCASIEYLKVPSPVQLGDNYTIADQRKADAMEGIRFYLPRPYVNLKQPVPIAARVAFVSLEYQPRKTEPVWVEKKPDAQGAAGPAADPPETTRTFNGKTYVLKTRVTSGAHFKFVFPRDCAPWLHRTLPPRISVSQATELFSEARRRETAQTQAGKLEETKNAEQAKADAEAAKPPTSVTGRVGFINNKDPITELGPIMDVVYLPDMDEQYVIKRNYGLGSGDLQVALRNGWAAETFGESVDNSNLIPYVIDQFGKASDAAANVAKTWGLKSVGALTDDPVDMSAGDDDPEGGGESTAAETQAGTLENQGSGTANDPIRNLLGQMVLMKVVQVKVAQPGLYPLLKPREILDWYRLTYNRGRICDACSLPQGQCGCVVNPEFQFEQFLRSRKLHWIRPDQVFVPAPPFTMVGFNVVTDAYIGPITKDNMGLGSYRGTSKSGSGGSDSGAATNKILTGVQNKVVQIVQAMSADKKPPGMEKMITTNVKDPVKTTNGYTFTLQGPLMSSPVNADFATKVATEFKARAKLTINVTGTVTTGNKAVVVLMEGTLTAIGKALEK